MVKILTDQYEVYVSQFQATSTSIMDVASAQFRDTSILASSLSSLKSVFEEADLALDKYGTQNTTLTTSEEMQLNALGSKLKARIEAVVVLFPNLEAADLKYIQSRQVASLDQPALKGVAGKMKAVDETFAAHLKSMIPPDPGDEPQIPGEGDIDTDTDGDNIENVPEADEIVLIDG
ncbi:MAG: hypothetical protein JKY27_05210 [Magnetovibrio sp.]|nr:hypothetical protein [Magnetovibrio sp.]